MPSFDLNELMADRKQEKVNLGRIRECAKDEVFHGTIFLFSKSALEEGGRLHSNYLKGCRPIVANGMLKHHESTEDANRHLNQLWVKMTRDDCHKEWIAAKRSNVHQAVQDKFYRE